MLCSCSNSSSSSRRSEAYLEIKGAQRKKNVLLALFGFVCGLPKNGQLQGRGYKPLLLSNFFELLPGSQNLIQDKEINLSSSEKRIASGILALLRRAVVECLEPCAGIREAEHTGGLAALGHAVKSFRSIFGGALPFP